MEVHSLQFICYKKPKCLFWCLIIAILSFHIQLQRWIWTLHCLVIDRKTKAKLGSTFSSHTLENLMPYWLHLKMPIALTSLLDLLPWPFWCFLFHKLLGYERWTLYIFLFFCVGPYSSTIFDNSFVKYNFLGPLWGYRILNFCELLIFSNLKWLSGK